MMLSWMMLGCTPEENKNPFADVMRYHTSLSSLEQNVQTSLADGLPNMLDVFTAYEDMMTDWADASCPEFNIISGGVDGHWVDDCETSDGYRFNGFVLYSGFNNSVGEDEFGGQFGNVWGALMRLHRMRNAVRLVEWGS